MSVDVEDYYHVSAFAGRIKTNQWDQYESRVVDSTHRVLRLMERNQVRATFFVLGWVAHRYPQLVRDIQRAGHEIGCHSYWHRLVYDMTPESFRDDLVQGRDVLEQITGEAVTAYRAPSFSITKRSLWALDILADEGFRLDSSIFPVHHDRYGIPDAPRSPHEIQTAHGPLWEFPPSVFRIAGLNVPVSGGGYFRLYPLALSVYFLRQVNEQQKCPFVFYFHPWEVDPDQPRLPASRATRIRHYLNLHRTERRLERLLQRIPFDSVSRVSGPESVEHAVKS